MGNEEHFVVVRADNNHFIKNVNQSEWTHNISNAKFYTKEAASDKVDEIEASDFEFRVYISPSKEELEEYRRKFG